MIFESLPLASDMQEVSGQYRWVPQTLGLLTPTSAFIGLYLGEAYMGITILYLLVFSMILDLIFGKDNSDNPDQEGIAHDIIIHTHALLVPILTIYMIYTISTTEWSSYHVLGIISVGLSNGASGIITAHELGHRKPKSFSWYLARLDLMSVLYLHFTTEHNYTHHKHWARPVDPTSSKFGVSIYSHFIRTVPLQIKGALSAKKSNTLKQFAIEATITLVIFAFSPIGGIAFIGQALIAIFLLEFVNYLQHHGLERGEKERAGAQHAWESRHRWSRWTLLELPLHPSHHLKASTHYERLEVHDDSPQLPYGYYVMFWISLIPPLFERLMKKSHDSFLSQ